MSRTGFVVIGLTGSLRPTSSEALKTATDALTVRFSQAPASEPRFTGFVNTSQPQPGIRLARYEAAFLT